MSRGIYVSLNSDNLLTIDERRFEGRRSGY